MKLVAKKPVLKKPSLKPVVEQEEKKEIVTKSPVGVSLRDIMDYDRVFNIIYSGVEQEEYFNKIGRASCRERVSAYV